MTEAIRKANELKQAEAIKMAEERTKIAENQVLILSVKFLVLTRLLAQAPPPGPATLLVPEPPAPPSEVEDNGPDPGPSPATPLVPEPPAPPLVPEPPAPPSEVEDNGSDSGPGPDTVLDAGEQVPPSPFVTVIQPIKQVTVMNGSSDDNCYVIGDSST